MQRFMRNRVFLGFDLVTWALIPALALALRLDWPVDYGRYSARLAAFTLVGISAKFLVLWQFGLYRHYWRYASVDELLKIVAGVVSAGVVIAVTYFTVVGPLLPEVMEGLVPATPRLPRSLPVIDTLLTLVFFGGSRFSIRAFHSWQRRQSGRLGEPVLIVGAGEAGAMIARELRANPQSGLDPVGFVDDDGTKQHRVIQGLPVLGDLTSIPRLAKEYRFRQAIIAMPAASGKVIRDVRAACHESGVVAKTIPSMFDIISGRVKVGQLRAVQIEDLLRREPVVIDQQAAGDLVRGSTVLITGAGGSIGSEICRQVAALGVRQLVLFDHGENPVFHIHNELVARYRELTVVPVIGDVRHAARVDWMMERFRPQVVFHAAAHKHVPLMELNPEEAVTNNVGGTLNLVRAAERVGVPHFVLISTDKAVNPTNVMGATKLLAEMLVHDVAMKAGRHYLSVRFGNVLGSEGSVVPLFQAQIAAGGPVTVTHPDMVRYFMTIPEAVQLVLQAAALGRVGETFVLDMGEPVKIVDLAKDLIELSGLELGKDISIVYSGLRPGERLSESLTMADETRELTPHPKVFVARNGRGPYMDPEVLQAVLIAAQGRDPEQTKKRLAALVRRLRTGASSAEGPFSTDELPPLQMRGPESGVAGLPEVIRERPGAGR